MKSNPMQAHERRAVGALASIFALRMLGLFLMLPVLALYANGLDGATPFLVGLAFGIYGLTQATLQIPFGTWSDRVGRKTVITAGLLIFAVGSVVAAESHSISGVIIGRALQGAGAIASAVLALAADLTPDQQRTKAMAMIGASIGVVFVVALMLGPVLDRLIGVSGIFWLTAVLAIAAIAVLRWVVPNPDRMAMPPPSRRGFAEVLRNTTLLRFDAGIFLLHLVMTSLFVAVPFAIRDRLGWPADEHWKVYVPVLILSLVGFVPLVMRHERQGGASFRIALLALAVSQAVLVWWHGQVIGIYIGLWLFFIGFNALEAMLPSGVSRAAPAARKGAALGVYNTCEFLGVFTGGALGGALAGCFGVGAVFGLNLVAALIWLALALTDR